MDDAWRIKKYYEPRILLGVDDVLTPLLADCATCLTGSELYIIRNLLAYAHRRSSWVQEYGSQGTYLAPTNDVWDDLMVIVSQLEGKLMDCTDLANIIESGPYTRISDSLIQAYQDSGALDWLEDWSGNSTAVDEERCAVATLTYQIAYEVLTEEVLPLQDQVANTVLIQLMTLLGTMLGATVIGIPTAAILGIVSLLVRVWIEGEQANIVNWMESNKDELTCAMYDALDGGTFADAAVAARGLIDAWGGFSLIDRQIMRELFGPATMGTAAAAYALDTDWAEANFIGNECDECESAAPDTWSFYYTQTENCPTITLGPGTTCVSGTILLDAWPEWFRTEAVLCDGGAQDYRLRVQITVTSSRPVGYDIEGVTPQISYNGTDWLNWDDGDDPPMVESTGPGWTYYDSGWLNNKGLPSNAYVRLHVAKATIDGYYMQNYVVRWDLEPMP